MKSGKTNLQQRAAKGGWNLLAGSVCGFLAFAGILCVCAAVLCKVDLPMNVLAPMMIGVVCISVFVAALVLGALQKRRGLLLGSGFGLAVFLLLWLVSVLQGGLMLTQLAAIKAFSVVIAGAFGGYLGVLRGEAKKRLH